MSNNPKVKTILVSQPSPENGRNVYEDLISKHKVKVDFRPFIELEAIPGKDLRKKRMNILEHSAIILNSKNAVNHFFRVVEELKIDLPVEMKYFCLNEAIAMYIQKYIMLRKRRVFYPKKRGELPFLKLLLTHKTEYYLYPCSDIRKSNIPDFLKENGIRFKESIMYHTVSADLSDLTDVFYDVVVFFSPADIKSLYDNFPDFKQNQTRIAGWGETTQQAIEEAKLVCNIPAPTPDAPSIVAAIENYILQTTA
jgi:uroporphyrinogen-III synthase